jgi:hypothetical protein
MHSRTIYLSFISILATIFVGVGIGIGLASANNNITVLSSGSPLFPAIAAIPTAVPGGPGYLMLGPADFNFFAISFTEDDANNYHNASIHLPQNAHITKVTAYYFDKDATYTPKVQLMRQNMSISEIVTSIPLPSTFSNGDNVVSFDVTTPLGVIDNARYAYRIRAIFNNGQAFGYYKVRVDYVLETSMPIIQR